MLDQSESALYDLEMEINSISFDLDSTIDFIVSDVRQYYLKNLNPLMYFMQRHINMCH